MISGISVVPLTLRDHPGQGSKGREREDSVMQLIPVPSFLSPLLARLLLGLGWRHEGSGILFVLQVSQSPTGSYSHHVLFYLSATEGGEV